MSILKMYLTAFSIGPTKKRQQERHLGFVGWHHDSHLPSQTRAYLHTKHPFPNCHGYIETTMHNMED
jgi:hypothetical protein